GLAKRSRLVQYGFCIPLIVALVAYVAGIRESFWEEVQEADSCSVVAEEVRIKTRHNSVKLTPDIVGVIPVNDLALVVNQYNATISGRSLNKAQNCLADCALTDRFHYAPPRIKAIVPDLFQR